MRTVTSYYFASRKQRRRNQLPWYVRNEIANKGYVELLPTYSGRSFSISRFMEDAGRFYRQELQGRYSEDAEWHSRPSSWLARFSPWERKGEKITAVPVLYPSKERLRYVDTLLDRVLTYPPPPYAVEVVFTPYGGLPLVCLLQDGKVTIL